MNKEAGQEIIPYLNEIADRLKTGHASIMVGAGFSKNAIGQSKSKKFLSWDELGDKFFDKLNEGCKSEKKLRNPLRLAGEVEAVFGRPTLNNIIRASIPDNEFQPSELHKKLLSLPWTDVFTTNYDTLLERAAEDILQFRYEPVINSEDLVLSTKPRIIKLHGSFPSACPFIITEEDYRMYPSRYASFVNTVQQSLLENTLCLIGFSGDDPNFINWAGWIRDNLGAENSPKIYLIGILDLSYGQKKLLENKNIIPLDISFYSPKHYDALSHFFDFLLRDCQSEETYEWPGEKYFSFNPQENDFELEIENAICAWEKARKKYPNWIIAPHDYRTKLRLNTLDNNFIYAIEKIKKPNDIIIIYEFNWRMEKSLFPLLRDWAPIYYFVIDAYNPYPDRLQIPNASMIKRRNEPDWEKISICWIEISLSLLSFYRHEGADDDWDLLSKRLDAIDDLLQPEQYAKYHYERCLRQLFLLNISTLRNELKFWENKAYLPYWDAKKAGLLAEIGDLDEAHVILENALKQVRKNLFLNPVKNDYNNISQEAYILLLLSYIQDSIRYSKEDFSRNEERKEFRKRWSRIKEYECDPWGELEQFELSFEIKPPPYKNTEKEYGFNINQQKTITRYGDDEFTIKAYAFLLYMEEAGIPYRIPEITLGNKTAIRASERIADYSFDWALVTLIRAGDEKDIDTLFGRKALVEFDQEYADKLSELFLGILEKSAMEFKDNHSIYNRDFSMSLAVVLPQILSHLCVKNSYDVKLKILRFTKNVYSSSRRNNYGTISKLMQNLVKSFSNKEQRQLFGAFFEFPLVPDTSRYSYPDPFQYIDIDNVKTTELSINPEEIDKALDINLNDGNNNNLEKLSNLRRKHITRLVALWVYRQMNDTQTNIFANILWKERKPNGFPADTNYYEFAFLGFPYPETLETTPHQLLKEYIDLENINFNTKPHGINEIEMTGGSSNIINNIFGTKNKKIIFHWDSESINTLFLKVVQWWDADKKYLLKHKDKPSITSILNEFKSRFSKMINIFVYIFAPNADLIDEEKIKCIDRIIKELPSYGLDSLPIKAAFFNRFPETKQNLFSDIENILLSHDESKTINALDSILVLLRQRYDYIDDHISLISQNIKLRSEKCIKHYIDTMIEIVKNHPQYLSETSINDINVGLLYLMDELIISNEDTIEQIHKKTSCRIAAIKLVIALGNYFNLNNIEIPSYISEWERLSLNKDEFSEIRNAWKDNE